MSDTEIKIMHNDITESKVLISQGGLVTTPLQRLFILVKVDFAHLLQEILQDSLLTSLTAIQFDGGDEGDFGLQQICVLASQSVEFSSLVSSGTSRYLPKRDVVGLGTGGGDCGRVVVVVNHALHHAQLVPLFLHMPEIV